MMTIKHGVLRIWTRGELGLFACKTAPSARSLEKAVDFWRRAGCRQVFGPVSAGAADLQSGLCVWRAPEKAELLAPRWAVDDYAFLQAGFEMAGESLAFRLKVPRLPDRPGMEVTPGVSAKDCAVVMGAEAERARMALAEMKGLMDPDFCFTAWHKGPAGILICLRRQKKLRLLTLWARADCRNGAACMPMLSKLAQAADRAGIETIDAAQIPADNPFSLPLVKRLGGQEIARYRQYKMNL